MLDRLFHSLTWARNARDALLSGIEMVTADISEIQSSGKLIQTVECMSLLLLPRCLYCLDDLLHHTRIGQLPRRLVISSHGATLFLLTVDISPNESSSPDKILRRMRLMILPERVLGKSSITNTAFGAAKGPIDFRTWATRSLRIWSFSSLPSLRATKALTA